MRERIIHGDCRTAMRRFVVRIAQITLADPPYFQVLDHEWDQQWRNGDGYLACSIDWMAGAIHEYEAAARKRLRSAV